MSIEFMVIAAPRSATTWAANWLSTDTTMCLHGLNARLHYSEWDNLTSSKMLGVSDPSISRFHEWLNTHQARKLIIHRDSKEIAESLGMDEVPSDFWCLDKVQGMHVDFREMFEEPKPIYEFLLQKEFDAERFDLLSRIQVNTVLEKVRFDKSTMARLMGELNG